MTARRNVTPLGLRPFSGDASDVVRYLQVDVAKAFADLFSIIRISGVGERYESAISPETPYDTSGAPVDIATLALDQGTWTIGAILNVEGLSLSDDAIFFGWISQQPVADYLDGSDGGPDWKLGMGGAIVALPGATTTGEMWGQMTLHKRLTIKQRSNIYLGSKCYFSSGVVYSAGSIWAIGRA